MQAIATLGLVRRLLTYEAAERQDQAALIEAAERVSDKLRAHLSKRIGQEGFRTLLARALVLTTAEFPHLSAARVGTDGSLIGLQRIVSPAQEQNSEAQADTPEGAIALVARLMELLATFIGETLTLRLISALWPELAWDDATDGETQRP